MTTINFGIYHSRYHSMQSRVAQKNWSYIESMSITQ